MFCNKAHRNRILQWLSLKNENKLGNSNFLDQFRKLYNCYKRTEYSLYIMRQTACQVINPITVDGYALFFNCTTVVKIYQLNEHWRLVFVSLLINSGTAEPGYALSLQTV